MCATHLYAVMPDVMAKVNVKAAMRTLHFLHLGQFLKPTVQSVSSVS